MIETLRLIILPLNYSQLIKYLSCDGSLEEELKLNRSQGSISPDLSDALTLNILPAMEAPGTNDLYYTLWTIIDKRKKIMVGDLCFMGPPTPEGEIVLGYGTYENYRNQGYMFEAIGAITNWALSQEAITTVLAETEPANSASWHLLQKNGFKKVETPGEFLLWRYDKN
ncbi:MAG TPA: N-acetyltransferase [Bacteroidales bacterium]|nr:MAG: hypothetical protein A2X11_02795 [Bacteroidetes bacterium GWE2_42_24]PKP16517.1 MAG: N-acetyltransferase [Bacteroidetes bacterium HGW-Bacteroidetes-22]HBZ67676.1 N-acetyltransferase [Bacteroidales bacterium]